MNKKLINIAVAFVFAVVVGLVFFIGTGGNERDYFKYTSKSVLTVTPDTTLEDNRITSNFHLEAGDYKLRIKYISDSDTTLILRSISAYVAENDGWATLLEKPLLKGENELEFDFTSDQYYFDVMAVSEQSQPINLTVESISVESVRPVVYDSYGFSIAWGIIAFIFAWNILRIISLQKSKKQKYQQIAVLLIMGLTFLLCTRYMSGSGAIVGDDVKFHLSRVQSIAQSFSIGQFPSMTGTGFNNGYGYMNSAFYPELFMYLPGLFVFLGMSVTSAMGLFALVASLGGCFICYYSFYKISHSRIAAVSGSCVYMLSFYRMQNYYARMAIGEFLFMLFLPLVIYSIYNILFEKNKKWWLLAIACSCVFQSHMLGTAFTAVIGGVIIASTLAVMLVQKQKIMPIVIEFIKAAGATFTLNAFFIIPFIYYSRQDFAMFPTGEATVKVMLEGMFSLKAFIALDPKSIVENSMRGSLGPAIIIAFIIGFLLMTYNFITKKQWDNKKTLALCTLGLIAVFTPLATSRGLWETLTQFEVFSKIASIIQFPFRFTGLVTFCISLFACIALSTVKNYRVKSVLGVVICLTAVFSSYAFFDNLEVKLNNNPRFHYSTDAPPEYMLEDAGNIFEIIAQPKKVLTSEGITVTAYNKKASNIDLSFEGNTGKSGYIEVPIFYYSGYRAYLDGERVELMMGDLGKARIMLEENQSGNIHLGYYGFWFFKLANVISLASIGAVLWFIYSEDRQGTKSTKKSIS